MIKRYQCSPCSDIRIYPVELGTISLRGDFTYSSIYTEGDGPGHNWLTLNEGLSVGFWPTEETLTQCPGIVVISEGDYDDPGSIDHIDYEHTFHLLRTNMDSIIQYVEEIEEEPPTWISPLVLTATAYDCSTFCTTALRQGNIDIPILDWPNKVYKWLEDFENEMVY